VVAEPVVSERTWGKPEARSNVYAVVAVPTVLETRSPAPS
jgi:hypothetical protein